MLPEVVFCLHFSLNMVLLQDCPDQFQFVKNVVEKLGYEVRS